MNHSLKTRVLSMILAVVMVIGLVPMNAFATETEPQSTDPVTVTVKFDVNGGKGEYEDQTVVVGEKITKPEEDPSHDSATFAYWTADLEKNEEWNFEEDVVEAADNGEMTLYASWITPAAEPVPTETEPQPTESQPVETDPVTASYTVQHYLQNAEGGYELDEEATETLTGEVGAATTAVAKEYEGYAAKEFAQGTIAADGTTVVVINYDIVVADPEPTETEPTETEPQPTESQPVETDPVESTYTVQHYLQNAEGGYDLVEADTQTLTGEVGAATEAVAKTYEGYTAKDFAQGTIAEDGTTVVAIYYDITAPATAEYKVEHYLQTEDGYELDEEATETLSGEVGAATNAAAKEYEGYTANPFEQGVIAEDGSTVVKIEYSMDPVAAAATENGIPSDMTLLSDKESTLAPGITERKVTVYDKNGNQVKMYIATANTSVETVEIYANYKDNQYDSWGMQKTTDQAAAFEANHEGKNVIVAINASYFNTTTGQPTGAFAMEGVLINSDSAGNAYPFFAVLKDGTAMIGAKGEYTTYKDQIQEAIGGWIHLVKDGAICSGLNTVEKYPRQTIGITEDGQVILMMADCLASAGSDGLTIQEQAEVMLALGCVEALHLDGGGSGTYCSQAAGTDTLEVVNNPSNGSERAVSNTLIFVSTAKPDGTFDRAELTAEHTYVTPGSTVEVFAVGLDASSGAAELPADVVWQLSDSTLGTVENGVFTSNGTVGTAVVQMVYNGTVVGETNIEVVNPDSLSFGGLETVVIPYDKSVELPLTAYYGVNEVFYNAGDFQVVLEDAAAATVSGLTITAPTADSGVTGTNVTVSLKSDETVSISVALTFGKGSEVIFDFEEGSDSANIDNWIIRTHESDIDNNEQGEIYIVNKDTGLIHDGEQALAFHTDFSQADTSGSETLLYSALSLSWNGDAIPVKGAQSIGFWLYIPEDAMATEITLNLVYYDANGNPQRRTLDAVDDNGEYIYTPYWSTNMEESGWHYVKIDTSGLTDDLYIHDEPTLSSAYKRNFFIKMYCVSGPGTQDFPDGHGDFTYYIDNITVDYSDAVEDREVPVFGTSTAYGVSTGKTMEYGKVTELTENELIFGAAVADNTNKTNYTGLNASTAKVYIDGNAVSASYADGLITSENVSLADGYHRVRFEIADNNGNVKTIVREVNVTTGSGKPTVELVPHDATLDRLLSGSVYWVDLVSGDIADIQKITALLDLNSTNQWELEHMVVSSGFDVSWSSTAAQAAQNDVVLTVTRNGEEIDASSNVIASIPVRVWASRMHEYEGLSAKTPEAIWQAGYIVTKKVIVEIDQGLVTWNDNSSTFFSDNVSVDHEAYINYWLMDQTYWSEKGSYHVHTATALDDVAATCTEDGYTGRTYCDVCASVVDWGTAVDATGHTYELTDGVVKCACGETFTGTWTDGKEYVDGVCVADGWVGESYYKDGVKLTGIQKVPAPDSAEEFYYDFGEDGVCANKIKYSGLFYDASVAAYRYSKIGELIAGWVQIDEKWHYFDSATKNAVTGDYYYAARGITYHFDETGMTEGVWQKTREGTRFWYGKWYYQAGNTNQRYFVEIDGKTYNFDKDGYLTTGIHALYDDWTHMQRGEMDVWEFDEDGALLGQITTKGLIDNKRGDMYLVEEDGYVHGGNARAVEYDGAIYFVCHSGKLKRDGVQNITTANGSGLLAAGSYYFGEDCKLFNGIKEESDGLLYYYKNGQIGKRIYNSELAEINGNIYLVKWSGKVSVNEFREITAAKSNGLLTAGTYYFGADGMLYSGTGVVWNESEQLYYYCKDGKLGNRIYTSELVEINGDIYLVKWSGKVAANETRVIPASKTNGLLTAGTYYFDADGKLFTGVKEEQDGLLYYYRNGQLGNRIYTSELVEINGDIYLVKWSGKVACNETRDITTVKANGLLKAGTYYFGANGKLFTGVMEGTDGVLYYYYNGQLGNRIYTSELVEINGDIYLVKWSGKVAVNETREITSAAANGLIKAGTYYFGEDGKLQT